MRLHTLISICILTLSLISCQSTADTEISQSQQVTLTPPPLDQSYPAPQEELATPALPEGFIRFTINKPVLEGNSVVSGTGTPDVPIYLHDITFMGEILGQGYVDTSGVFEITVIPLEAGHRIGISLGELSGLPWNKTDFQNPALYGDEARQVPMVGFFYDTAMVSSK